MSEKIGQLKMTAPDGKIRLTDCANTETMFRIIQSIPSPKAEPFKRWLAKVGYQRVQEIEDPELGQKRTRAIYKAKGYSDDWIEKRMRGIAIREELTDEWKKRDVKQEQEYAILTAEIAKAAFCVTPGEHKKRDVTVWLTQKLMAELSQKDVRIVNEHIKNIFIEGELSQESTIRNFRITAAGKERDKGGPIDAEKTRQA